MTARGRAQIFWSAYVVTFLLCFVVTGIWSMWIGTFTGEKEGVRYFIDDWHNLLLYAVICPAYVGFGIVLIATVTGGYWELRRLEDEAGEKSLEIDRVPWHIPSLVLLILTVSLTLTSLYISDVSNIERTKYVYWFLDEIGPGVVRLNSLGVYYFLLNFTLLLITLVSLAFFMSAFAATIRIASRLTEGHTVDRPKLTIESVSTKLQTFVGAYLAAKFQVAAYVLNFWIWQKSPLGTGAADTNIFIAHVFLVVIGVFFLAIPRDYLELQWHRYRWSIRESEHRPEELNVEHLVDPRAALWAKAIDVLLMGSIIYIPFLSDFMSY